MTLKADGTQAGAQSTLRCAARVLSGELEPGWALLEATADEQFSGWTIYGPGDFTDERLPQISKNDELVEVTFSAAGHLLPDVRELHNWGNDQLPLLMQSWAHQGRRKWMPWEDFSTFREPLAE